MESVDNMLGRLSIVATPIGNLEDITLRALRVLGEADMVLAEDTRVTQKLLDRHAISAKVTSYHTHSRDQVTEKIIDWLQAGQHLALVTDAGTPGISDPGNELVSAVWEALGDTVSIETIPGPSAVTAVLAIAGKPTHEFQFLGFIPTKKGRKTMLERLAKADMTTIVYESSHRIMKTLEALQELCPEKGIVIGRELTKLHETMYRGTVVEVYQHMQGDTYAQKGEFVLVI